MRNFLPAPHKKAKRSRHYYALAVTLPMVLAAGLIWYKAAHAAPACTRGYGAVPTANTPGNPGDNAKYTEWDAGGYHYKIYKFGILGDPGAASGTLINSSDAACAGSDTVDPSAAGLQWNGRTAVAAWLGVPANLGAPDTGKWQSDTNIGLTPRNRPPQYMDNFDSDAAVVDDAGRAVIDGGRGGTQTIWCLNLDTGANPRGVRNCQPDITTGNNHNGSGHLFIFNNCHLGDGSVDHTPPDHDSDGYGPVRCANNEANWSWYQPFLGRGHDSDLSNVIGCTAAGVRNLPCDEATRPLQSFQLHMSSRQTECCGFGAIMYVTMRYSTTASISIDKTIIGSTFFDENQPVRYNVKVTAGAGVRYTDFQIDDNIKAGDPAEFDGACSPDPLADPQPLPGRPGVFLFDAGRNQTWLDALNRNGSINFCVLGKTHTIGSATQTFENDIQVIAHVTSGQLVSDPGSAIGTIRPSRYPFLTTSGGDVNAGGGIGVSCSTAGDVNVNPGGKGDYVVSAYGAITTFGSDGNPAGTNLSLADSAHYYAGLCRPDMVAAATKTITSLGCGHAANPVVICTNNQAVATNALNTATTPTIVKFTGSLLLPSRVVKAPVTLFVTGNLAVLGDITAPLPGICPASGCPSLGVIAGGNVSISNSATRLAGYYYAKGNLDTCLEGNIGNLKTRCNSQLFVAGLLSANHFNFDRIGASGTVPGETIFGTLGLLFVSPPPIFDGSFNSSSASQPSEGQAPPQY